MTFGTLYGSTSNVRSYAPLIVAKALGLEVKLVDVRADDGKHRHELISKHPVNRMPFFEGTDGFELYETIAITVYFASQKEGTDLLGHSKQEYALILQNLSYFNSQIIGTLASWVLALRGMQPYVKKNVDKDQNDLETFLAPIETVLSRNTFLVGERKTVADYFAFSILTMGFKFVFGDEWRKKHPHLTRFYQTIGHQKETVAALGEPAALISEAIKYTPPKKAEKPKAAPKAAAKAEKKHDDEEDKPAPKPKHPLEALGAAACFPIDQWKREYSNEETREVALPWFFEHYDPKDYSIYRVDYKYNDELTLTFMSSNLITGFFNRLQASTKYLFGAMSVYGENKNNVISGAFLVRGQDYAPAFDVAPDWDSYSYTKLDVSKPKDKEFLEDAWAWDKPLVLADGTEKQFVDGKVFK